MPAKLIFPPETLTAMEADLIEQLRLSHCMAETSLHGLAADYGCSHGTIWRVERGDLDNIRSSALKPEQIAEIKAKRELYHASRETLLNSYSMAVLAKKYGTSIQTLYRHLWRIKDSLGHGKPLSALWEAA